MILLESTPINSIDDARARLQTAIGVEFGTLPPYLYALFSIPPGKNPEAVSRIRSVVMEEMVHMCLDCNILNAIGGDPRIVPPAYPGPLPGSIGHGGKVLTIHLLPFSRPAMRQAMAIEEPEKPIKFPKLKAMAAAVAAQPVTIGQFYRELDAFLATLPDSAWQPGRNQLDDRQFFQGQLFPIGGYADAHRAIDIIVSEGEGAPDTPLDFEEDLAHYYRFEEIRRNRVLTKAPNPQGYAWGDPLGVKWSAAYNAISDPGSYDFSGESAEAQAVQSDCNAAFSRMVQELQAAVTGHPDRLGNAVRAMFDLRLTMLKVFTVPLSNGKVAGPSFQYVATTSGVSS